MKILRQKVFSSIVLFFMSIIFTTTILTHGDKNNGDIYSRQYNEREYEEFINKINNEVYYPIIDFENIKNGIRVTSIENKKIKNNLSKGDVILKINGKVTKGLTYNEIEGLYNYKKSNTLQIIRGSKNIITKIYFEKVQLPTVTGKVLENHIGYISITTFGTKTGEEFKAKIESLEKSGVDSYIIDLRNNMGGYVDDSLEILGYFIGKKTAFLTKNEKGITTKHYAVPYKKNIDKPIICLMNEKSASTSEIVLSSLKYYKRAYLIGNKSFGKGSIQELNALPNGEIRKETIEYFYTPGGGSVDGVGVIPDLVCSDEECISAAINKSNNP